MKIALIGADGQLGSDLMRILDEEDLHPLYYPDFDITQPVKVREVLSGLKADIIINTAAFHRVDECESHPQQSFLVNAVAVRNLALICRELGAVLVHFSTDYVFDGRKREPYVEEDIPRPLNVYGVSKLSGEFFVHEIMERYFLIRSCGLYGRAGCREKGTNFIESMLFLERLGKPIRIVHDQYVTPTSTEELAVHVGKLIRTSHFGLYHLTNEGECTWYEFAQTIFSLLGKNPRLIPVDSNAYGARARRPLYSVLENKRAKATGLSEFAHWKTALKKFLKETEYSLAE
ncbi:MAG: dTDP-4-dehydrorhamnose reductase [Candidatus Aminicenantales bacterium]